MVAAALLIPWTNSGAAESGHDITRNRAKTALLEIKWMNFQCQWIFLSLFLSPTVAACPCWSTTLPNTIRSAHPPIHHPFYWTLCATGILKPNPAGQPVWTHFSRSTIKGLGACTWLEMLGETKSVECCGLMHSFDNVAVEICNNLMGNRFAETKRRYYIEIKFNQYRRNKTHFADFLSINFVLSFRRKERGGSIFRKFDFRVACLH